MDLLFDVNLLNATIRMVTPILLAALGASLCLRAGLFNMSLEGLLLVGAFGAVLGNYVTQNLWLAGLTAIGFSLGFSLVFGYLTIFWRANEIVVAVALNLMATGLTTFLLRSIFDVKGAFYDKDMIGLPHLDIGMLSRIPILGPMFNGQTWIVYFAFLTVILLYVYYYKTVSGFRLQAVGEHYLAAQSIGIRVRAYQFAAVLICGVLCGLAGAQLSLGQVTMFTEGMTSGRGFIALVAMMLGKSGPLGILAASLLFGFMDALSVQLQGFAIPAHITLLLPYLMTLVALFLYQLNQSKRTRRAGHRSSLNEWNT